MVERVHSAGGNDGSTYFRVNNVSVSRKRRKRCVRLSGVRGKINCCFAGVGAHMINRQCGIKRVDVRSGHQFKGEKVTTKVMFLEEQMDPQIKLRIKINKLGAELRRAERKMDAVEERLCIARSAIRNEN